jgi:hypothetical protein
MFEAITRGLSLLPVTFSGAPLRLASDGDP